MLRVSNSVAVILDLVHASKVSEPNTNFRSGFANIIVITGDSNYREREVVHNDENTIANCHLI